MWGATALLKKVQSENIISIHAPVWGATIEASAYKREKLNFNSRSRVGSDFPTPFIKTCVLYFNSRSRVGSDNKFGSFSKSSKLISIHAPVWGATNQHF